MPANRHAALVPADGASPIIAATATPHPHPCAHVPISVEELHTTCHRSSAPSPKPIASSRDEAIGFGDGADLRWHVVCSSSTEMGTWAHGWGWGVAVAAMIGLAPSVGTRAAWRLAGIPIDLPRPPAARPSSANGSAAANGAGQGAAANGSVSPPPGRGGAAPSRPSGDAAATSATPAAQATPVPVAPPVVAPSATVAPATGGAPVTSPPTSAEATNPSAAPP